MRLGAKIYFQFSAAALIAIFLLTSCAATEPRPAGISRFISFSVTPLYPKSFEITAGSYHSIYGHFGTEELKEAWRKKAQMIASGHRFKSSVFIVHDNETDLGGGWPIQSRSVTATITLLD
jgi:hypothetical protein